MLTSESAFAKLLQPALADSQTFIPQFFRLDNTASLGTLEALLASDPQISVVDTLAAQVAELIKTRHPRQRFTLTELRERADNHMGAVRPENYGVWVYYPWSHRLVHLLDEAEFVELRTNRNHYKITPEEHHHLATKRIGVIGLSVGQSAALTLAMERSFGEIRLADFDTLDLSNLNRLRSGVQNIGLPKVIIAAREIAEIDPFLKVDCLLDGIDEHNIDRFLSDGGKLNLLIEESDGMDVKFLARYRARELGIPVIMDTSDRGLLDVERFDLEPTRPIFHGLVEDIAYQNLKGLTNEEKIPYALKIVGAETMSKRMKASLIEVEESLYTWPQLASNVVLGGALTADVARRILLDQYHASGRYFVDLEDLVRDPEQPSAVQEPSRTASALTLEHILTTVKIALQADTMPSATVELMPRHINALVAAGILAPSGGNCQPWKWLYRDSRLFLFHDEQRSASFLDYENCASYAALGAASENVILKAHALGLSVQFQPFPLAQDRRLVAVFGFAALPISESEPHVCDSLVDAIAIRMTNRRLGKRQPIPPEVLATIQQAAETLPGAKLHLVCSETALAEAAEILGAVERLRLLHPDSHHDMMNEIRWSRDEAQRSRDGIDLQTMELSAVDRAAMNVCRDWKAVKLVGQWGRGKALSKLTRKAVDAASCVALITLPDSTPTSYLQGGRALERAWLIANENNVAFQPLSPITYLFARLIRGNGAGMSPLMRSELSALRQNYLNLFGIQEGLGEILLFRLAVADAPTTYALRRPIADVLVENA